MQCLTQLRKLVLQVFLEDMPALMIFQTHWTCPSLEQVDLWSFVAEFDMIAVSYDQEWADLWETYYNLSKITRFPAMSRINISLIYSNGGPGLSSSTMQDLTERIDNQVEKGTQENSNITFSNGWEPSFQPECLSEDAEWVKWNKGQSYVINGIKSRCFL